jgi:hypothetical protein
LQTKRQGRPLLLDVRPEILLDEDQRRSAGLRQGQPPTVRPERSRGRSAEEAEARMVEISKRFHDEGGEIYVPAAE